jgi:hypothetical protein
MNSRHVLTLAIAGIVGTALLVTACGSSSKRASPSSAASAENTFVLNEFTIVPPTNTLRAGSVSITADNVGGEVHELVIVRASSAGALPTKSDSSVDEDKIAEADKVGEIEDIVAGAHRSKTFGLTAGTYVAFCNVIDDMMGTDTMMGSHMGSGGHVHFAEGMHVTFTVQ